MRKAGEGYFYSNEQVREHLTEALAIVDALDPPEDLRVAVFGKAAELVSGKQVVFEQVQPSGLLHGFGGQG